MMKSRPSAVFLGMFALAAALLAALPGFGSPPGEGMEKGVHAAEGDRVPRAGLTLENMLAQGLKAGNDPCQLLKTALSQGADLAKVFNFFLERLAADPDFAASCSPCHLLRCAVESGQDAVKAANAMMAAGGRLAEVRACLGAMGFQGSETYTYTPPDPPALEPGIIPSSLGNGGGAPVSEEDPSPSS